MRKGERLRLGASVGLILALTTAGIGLASIASDPLPDEVTTCQPVEETIGGDASDHKDEDTEAPDGIDVPDEVEASEDGADAEENQDSEAESSDKGGDCDAEAAEENQGVEASDGSEDDEGSAPMAEPTEEQIAACTGAAGLTSADAPTEKPTAGELHGTENAIAHVLWNCVRNDNEGLPNALSHLKANLDRGLLREELKAQRVAEREAAKSARRAAHTAARAARASTHPS
jgi:ribosomal protein S21